MAFTPRELDKLFLAIRETLLKNGMGAAMVALSNGNVEQARKAFDASKKHTTNALTNIDSLIVHAMKTAEPV